MRKKKRLQELTIKDNFMFGAVMAYEDMCRQLLEMVLEFPIEHVEVSKEHSLIYHPEHKGVRLMSMPGMKTIPITMWRCRWERMRAFQGGAGITTARLTWSYC